MITPVGHVPGEPDVEFLLRGLEERGIPFVVQVRARTLACGVRHLTVDDLANGTVCPGTTMLKVGTRNDRTAAASRFVAIPVPGEPEQTGIRAGTAPW